MQPLFISGWGATDQVWEHVLSAVPGTNPQFICWAECAQDWPRPLASVLAKDEQVVAPGSRPAGPPAKGRRSNQYCVVGWSLGGLLALRAALEFPDKIAGLVLISSSARMCAAEDYPGAD